MVEQPLYFAEQLSARKREILRRVINHYVRQVRPVSSKEVADEIGVSSATVRNELSALEELGFLHQLHTSGGRVPTDRAYRYLVEELVRQLSDTIAQRSKVSQVYSQLGREVEALLEGTLDLLTEMTGYVAWVSLPSPTALDVKSVNFVEVDRQELLVVLVTGAGAIQSKMIASDVPVKELGLGQLAEALNSYLRSRSVTSVDYETIRQIFSQQVNIPESLHQTIRDYFSELASGRERVLFGNALSLALQPEFTQVERLSAVINLLQNRERFIQALRRQLDERVVQTIIGSENTEPALQDCSLVLSRYGVPGGGEGTLGVLGPTRLFYERALPWVKVVGEAMAGALADLAQEGDDG